MNKILILFCALWAFSAQAREWSTQGPFTIRTQNPLYLQTVNLDPARATTLRPGELEIRVDSAYSNLYEREISLTADENLDMELWRINFVATYGFFPDFEGGMEIPLLHFGGGFLDAFVQKFHDFFGFPNGGREQVANGVFRYQISRNGNVIYNPGPQTVGLGDISFFLKQNLLEETARLPALAWRFIFKVPSGNGGGGLGDGSPGFGFGLALEKSYKRIHGYLNTNYLVDGGNSRLPNLMNSAVFDFSAAVEYSFSRRVSGIVQIVGGTPRLQGLDMTTWNGKPLDFIFGVRGDPPWGKPFRPFFWQVAFSEDILADGPSVDFTAWISVGFRFQAHKPDVYRGDFFARHSP